jgi:hypothetical protein
LTLVISTVLALTEFRTANVHGVQASRLKAGEPTPQPPPVVRALQDDAPGSHLPQAVTAVPSGVYSSQDLGQPLHSENADTMAPWDHAILTATHST